MHKLGVVLRSLNAGSIGVRRRNRGGFKVERLISFDFARLLQEDEGIVQRFLMADTRVAPEIEEGLFHDFSVDIWSLGQLGYQLMSVKMPKKEIEETKEEVEAGK